ncbi:hypothetical protein RV11_GL002407 [Enterococcus phoeniculicola]|nr:hypothetical protein RV11_GL002407 [Enterococcus phoeniculicola]
MGKVTKRVGMKLIISSNYSITLKELLVKMIHLFSTFFDIF